jgi:hypothetical protein
MTPTDHQIWTGPNDKDDLNVSVIWPSTISNALSVANNFDKYLILLISHEKLCWIALQRTFDIKIEKICPKTPSISCYQGKLSL